MGVSLFTGWLPVALSALGVLGAGFLLIRRLRWWWLWYVPTTLAASAIGAWILATVAGENLFAEALPFSVGIWIAVIIAAVLLAVGHLFASPWWDKVVAVATAIVVVAAAGNQINNHYQQYPTLGDVLGAGSDRDINGPPVKTTGPTMPPVPPGPLTQSWTPTGPNIPADGKGKVSQIDLPGTLSGFAARPGWVYYPPAYFADNPEPLPVLMMIVGQPGDPGDWFLGDRLQSVMDQYAQAHNGIAPIVVSPDPLGALIANPLCANSSLGQLDTYLSQDVPNAIKSQLLVETDPKYWAIGGFSYGGTCSLQMATNHPDQFPTFIDISGELEPTLGSRQKTVDTAFGGDTAAFTAINPMDIMAAKKFSNTAGWFIVGETDADYMPQQQQVYQTAKAAGMDVQYWVSPGTGHDWGTAVAGLAHVLPWLGTRLGLTA